MNKKIAITVVADTGFGAAMDEHFGRAPYFLMLTGESRLSAEIVQNDVMDAVHGAGTRAAALMATNGVTDIISGQFGPKAYSALEQLHINMWTAPNGLTAEQAVDEFLRGNLPAYQVRVYH